MERIVETFAEKSDRTLTDEHRELLLFLYGNLHLEELVEEEQNFFIEYFFNSETLRNVAAYAATLVEIIHEIEGNIPTIEFEERLANSEEQRLYYERKWHDRKLNELKQQTTKKGNVFYVPFAKFKKDLGPIIICLEQTEGISRYSEVCKSMILPLFAAAYCEHRDLYIVPYNSHIHLCYCFKNGHLNLKDFTSFIECDLDGEAAIIPVLQFATELLQEYQHLTDADIILFTEGAPIDGERLVEPNMKMMVRETINKFQADVSVIAMEEKNFNERHFWFANKVCFVDDTI